MTFSQRFYKIFRNDAERSWLYPMHMETFAMGKENTIIRVAVSPTLRQFCDPALLRLQYLFPTAKFCVADGFIEVTIDPCVDADALRREVHYTLYREKIYAETLPLRVALVGVLISK